MTDECPHCHGRVLLMADGRCPSCGKDSHDLAGTNPDITTVTVGQNQLLPDCCMLCGQGTTRRQRVTKATGSIVARAVVGQLFGVLGGLLAGLAGSNQEEPIRRVSVSVPVCHRCARAKPLEPEHVDLENYRMTFLAHRKFRQELGQGHTQLPRGEK